MTISTRDYVLVACDTLAYGEEAISEEASYAWETRMLLGEICASVEGIVEESGLDFSDSLADLDEMMDRHGL